MAERVGFEPTVRRGVQQISSLPHSTTLAPLRAGYFSRYPEHFQTLAGYVAGERLRLSLWRSDNTFTS